MAAKGAEEYASEERRESQMFEEENERLKEYQNMMAGKASGNYSVTNLGETTGKKLIEIDATKYDELYIEIAIVSSKGTDFCSCNIKTIALSDVAKSYIINGSWSGSGYFTHTVVSNSEVRLGIVRRDAVDCTETSKINLWGINY